LPGAAPPVLFFLSCLTPTAPTPSAAATERASWHGVRQRCACPRDVEAVPEQQVLRDGQPRLPLRPGRDLPDLPRILPGHLLRVCVVVAAAATDAAPDALGVPLA
jgi:hypothetical protein